MSANSQLAIDEYNAFGPWIARVGAAGDVPPVFASFPLDVVGSELILKFPRPESRRDLRAGMNLYDYLVAVNGSEVTVLAREGRGFTAGRFSTDAVSSMSSGADLLDGRFTLSLTSGQTYSIPYNGSSSAMVIRLVDTIRRAAAASSPHISANPARRGIPMPLGMDDLGKADTVFANTINDFDAAENDVTVLSAQGRRIIPASGSIVDRVRNRSRPLTLQGAVVASTPAELVIFSRRDELSRKPAPEMSMMRTVIMRGHIDSISGRSHPDHPEVAILTVTSGASSVDILLPSGAAVEQVVRGWR